MGIKFSQATFTKKFEYPTSFNAAVLELLGCTSSLNYVMCLAGNPKEKPAQAFEVACHGFITYYTRKLMAGEAQDLSTPTFPDSMRVSDYFRFSFSLDSEVLFQLVGAVGEGKPDVCVELTLGSFTVAELDWFDKNGWTLDENSVITAIQPSPLEQKA